MLDIRYITGFFDGEGCISVTRQFYEHRYTKYQLRVILTQKDKKVLKIIQKKWRGCFHNAGTAWQLVWSGRKAKPLLLALKPHTIVKYKHVILALQFIEHMPNSPNPQPKWMERAWKRMKKLNGH